jgi:predicted HNH restriction endonuclease
MGTPGGAGNDPRNVIIEQGDGLQDLGLVALRKQLTGRRETWSCVLTPNGEVTVAAYCQAHGIANPLVAREESDLMDQVELLQQSLEGRRRLREHLTRERDPALVRQFKSQLSSLLCSVCNFDFEGVYGPIGRGFIEAHHLEPIGSREDSTPTSVRDFIPVCSNCHRMIHTHSPPYTADEGQRNAW